VAVVAAAVRIFWCVCICFVRILGGSFTEDMCVAVFCQDIWVVVLVRISG